jgi:hypothetical protein
MKKLIRTIGILFTIVKISAGTVNLDEDPYLSDNIVAPVQDISISNLLDFKKIAVAIHDEFDKARFHYIIAYEIDDRLKELDEKFTAHEKKFHKTIGRYEDKLDLMPYLYTDDRPRFDYIYQKAEITNETIDNDIHRIQAELARSQFIQVYKYYRKRLNNYKNYLITLRELYKCKIIENKDNQVEFFSNFPEMYQDIKLFHDAMDDAGKMQVHRDVLSKVLYISWNEEGEKENIRRRNFKYYNDGTVSKLTDKIDDEIIFETWFGKNDIAENFIKYIFLPGFISRDYSYFTEIYYINGKPSSYKVTNMNDHVIGTIYLEFDEKDHLIKETWYKGETSKILRELTSIFDSAAGSYKLIERDRNGDIVRQETVISSNE